MHRQQATVFRLSTSCKETSCADAATATATLCDGACVMPAHTATPAQGAVEPAGSDRGAWQSLPGACESFCLLWLCLSRSDCSAAAQLAPPATPTHFPRRPETPMRDPLQVIGRCHHKLGEGHIPGSILVRGALAQTMLEGLR